MDKNPLLRSTTYIPVSGTTTSFPGIVLEQVLDRGVALAAFLHEVHAATSCQLDFHMLVSLVPIRRLLSIGWECK